jgi:hypothetical protein
MRAHVEGQLLASGLLPGPGSLSLAAYGVARNIAAEVGSGAGSTPEEKVAIAEAAINRARSYSSVVRMLLKDGKWFGRQWGRNPPVATSQDPTLEELYVAQLAVTGQTGGFARGASHYYDPRAQDEGHARDPARYTKDARGIYESWTQGGLAWVGDLPGIDPRRLFLLKKASGSAWQAAYTAGKASGALAGPLDPAAVFRSAFSPPNHARTFFFCALGLAAAGGAGYAAWRYSQRRRWA